MMFDFRSLREVGGEAIIRPAGRDRLEIQPAVEKRADRGEATIASKRTAYVDAQAS
jgi:hypothetical protein